MRPTQSEGNSRRMPCIEPNNGCFPTAKCRFCLSCGKYLNTCPLPSEGPQLFWRTSGASCVPKRLRTNYGQINVRKTATLKSRKTGDFQWLSTFLWHTAKYVNPQSFRGLCPMEHRRCWPAFDMKNNIQIQSTVNTGQSVGTRFSTHHCLACGDKVFFGPHPTVYP